MIARPDAREVVALHQDALGLADDVPALHRPRQLLDPLGHHLDETATADDLLPRDHHVPQPCRFQWLVHPRIGAMNASGESMVRVAK